MSEIGKRLLERARSQPDEKEMEEKRVKALEESVARLINKLKVAQLKLSEKDEAIHQMTTQM
mgnify:CR=1 FL=1